uniref:Uncharacterized protein n=1 Tax=Rhizophora mucronata TaxID=61149 RepID=A0A2P2N5G0_RHIMU
MFYIRRTRCGET